MWQKITAISSAVVAVAALLGILAAVIAFGVGLRSDMRSLESRLQSLEQVVESNHRQTLNALIEHRHAEQDADPYFVSPGQQ